MAGHTKQTNTFVKTKDYFTGFTAKGESYFFDQEDYDKVAKYSWFMMKGYPTASKKHISLHAYLFGAAPDGYEIDHINRNPTDNRKSNLRFATRAENIANKVKAKGTSSQYKGVTFLKNKKLWRSVITYKGKHIYLLSSKSEEECAKAYNEKALFYYGEFAVLNVFPNVSS